MAVSEQTGGVPACLANSANALPFAPSNRRTWTSGTVIKVKSDPGGVSA